MLWGMARRQLITGYSSIQGINVIECGKEAADHWVQQHRQLQLENNNNRSKLQYNCNGYNCRKDQVTLIAYTKTA